MGNSQTRLLDGSTFVVSDETGDIGTADDLDGLFFRDVRHLSRWQVLVDGQPMRTVAADELEYDTAAFFAVESAPMPRDTGDLTLLRERHLARGMQERLTLSNVGRRRREVTVTVRFAADFADLFEVRERIPRRCRVDRQVARGEVTLCYQRGDYERKTHIRAAGATLTGDSAIFAVSLGPGEHWSTSVEVEVTIASRREAYVAGRHPHVDTDLPGWLRAMPRLETDWNTLVSCYQRSLVDLAALRFFPDVVPRASLLAAGLPWFMTLSAGTA
jgi:glycogen debranching enzyme